MHKSRRWFAALYAALLLAASQVGVFAQGYDSTTNAVNSLVNATTHANTNLTPVALGLSAVLVLWGIIKGIARKAKG